MDHVGPDRRIIPLIQQPASVVRQWCTIGLQLEVCLVWDSLIAWLGCCCMYQTGFRGGFVQALC